MPRDPLDGIITFKTGSQASAGAGSTDVVIRPAVGEAWEIIDLYTQQDDGAVYTRYLWTDPDVTLQTMWTCTSTGTSGKFHIGCDGDASTSIQKIQAPMVLTYDRYLTGRFTASAGAKTITWYAMVRVFKGLPVEA